MVASDTAFPVWRGVVNGAPGVGHQIDCTNTNPYFGAKGCAVDVHTVSSGRNCAYEIITASQGTFGSTFHQTPCAVSITGSITFAPTPAGCVYTGHRLTMSWESGINSTLFGVTVPVTGTFAPTNNAANWVLKITTYEGIAIDNHVVTFSDTFGVKFNRSIGSCPGPDVTNLKANVWDLAANTSFTGDGVLVDDIVAG